VRVTVSGGVGGKGELQEGEKRDRWRRVTAENSWLRATARNSWLRATAENSWLRATAENRWLRAKAGNSWQRATAGHRCRVILQSCCPIQRIGSFLAGLRKEELPGRKDRQWAWATEETDRLWTGPPIEVLLKASHLT